LHIPSEVTGLHVISQHGYPNSVDQQVLAALVKPTKPDTKAIINNFFIFEYNYNFKFFCFNQYIVRYLYIYIYLLKFKGFILKLKYIIFIYIYIIF